MRTSSATATIVLCLVLSGCFVALDDEPVCFDDPAVSVVGDPNTSEICCGLSTANDCGAYYLSDNLVDTEGNPTNFCRIHTLAYCDEAGFCRLACDIGVNCECRTDRDCPADHYCDVADCDSLEPDRLFATSGQCSVCTAVDERGSPPCGGAFDPGSGQAEECEHDDDCPGDRLCGLETEGECSQTVICCRSPLLATLLPVTPPEAARGAVNTTLLLQVRLFEGGLLDEQMTPIIGEPVNWEIGGDAQGSTLESSTSATDDEGIAGVNVLLGSVETEFTVTVSVPPRTSGPHDLELQGGADFTVSVTSD